MFVLLFLIYAEQILKAEIALRASKVMTLIMDNVSSLYLIMLVPQI
jgi:hypothetical protein